MIRTMRTKGMIGMLFAAILLAGSPAIAAEQAGAKLERDSRAALATLYKKTPGAKALGSNASAILIFPTITKAGFVVGAQHGKGVLLKGGKNAGYFNTTAASYGLQAGVQTYGYAMFFMNDEALQQLYNADGFEVGVGPSVVVVDAGFGKSATTTTMKEDVYAFIFSQKGLMAGVGLQGSKISRADPK